MKISQISRHSTVEGFLHEKSQKILVPLNVLAYSALCSSPFRGFFFYFAEWTLSASDIGWFRC